MPWAGRTSILGALLLATSAVPELAAQQADTTAVRITAPDSVGAFVRVSQRDFDDPAQGSMFRYMRPDSLIADVFLYPGPDLTTDCPIDCARGVIEREVGDFVAAFPELIRVKYVETIALHDHDTLTAAASDAWRLGRQLSLRIRRGGRDEWSDFYLYYLPGVRVKVRASYPPDSVRARAARDFTSALLSALIATPDTGLPRHLAVDVTIAGGVPQALALIANTLRQKGYEISDSSASAGRLVTAPKFTWPLDSENADWHGSESPGVVLFMRLTHAGDSTKVVISGRSPVKPGWKDAEVASMLEMISIFEIAAALPANKKAK